MWNSIHEVLNKYLKFLFINDIVIYVNYLVGPQRNLGINNIMSELHFSLMLWITLCTIKLGAGIAQPV
jgi:hypothetical protein